MASAEMALNYYFSTLHSYLHLYIALPVPDIMTFERSQPLQTDTLNGLEVNDKLSYVTSIR